jgi:hypothetical protein
VFFRKRPTRKFPETNLLFYLWTYVDRKWGQVLFHDSAEKPEECFDRLSMNGTISNDFNRSSVRPEALEG